MDINRLVIYYQYSSNTARMHQYAPQAYAIPVFVVIRKFKNKSFFVITIICQCTIIHNLMCNV